MLGKPEPWALLDWTAAHRMPFEACAAVEHLGPRITCHLARIDILDAIRGGLRL